MNEKRIHELEMLERLWDAHPDLWDSDEPLPYEVHLSPAVLIAAGVGATIWAAVLVVFGWKVAASAVAATTGGVGWLVARSARGG